MSNIEKLLEVMVALRSDCPWDRRQTFASIAPYTVEEAYEVADAISREDWSGLRDELGDLLLQVVFHSRMASEAGHFEFADVVDAICEKMERRHPHVFGTPEQRARGAVAGDWEAKKAAERGNNEASSELDGITLALPALSRAAKLGKRAARVGFDWPDQVGVEAKIAEEMDELREARQLVDKDAERHELGDLLFAVVNWARHLKIDPEQALTEANRRFEQRFRLLEQSLGNQGRALKDCDLDTLEAAWGEAKKRLNNNV